MQLVAAQLHHRINRQHVEWRRPHGDQDQIGIAAALHTTEPIPAAGNRYDLRELAGAFGDLGTLIPFVAAYIIVLKMDAAAILLGFGVALIVVGVLYRTPCPVQQMKAIGAVAIAQGAAAGLTAAAVVGAGLVTGLVWLVLGLTGMAKRAADLIPRPALLGVILGLGFSFMLEGIRMMAGSPWLSGTLLAMTLLMLSRLRFPAMLVLLAMGFLVALIEQPGRAKELTGIRVSAKLPSIAWSSLTWNDLWIGTLLLELPQLPLTFGNALIAITEENNRLFPRHAVSESRVSVSTGLMNLWSSAIGGIPLCHGAGGMAGHVRFGATTGGAAVMVGVLLTLIALLLGDSIGLLLRVFPQSVLGIILFLAGTELAMSSREPGPDKVDRFIVLMGWTTPALAEQQAALMLHRTRDLLIRQRTQLINALRAHLAEMGLVAAAGADGLKSLLAIVREASNKHQLPEPMWQALQALVAGLQGLGGQIGAIERAIHAQHRASEASRRLETIPGIGVIGATAIAATVTNQSAFKSGRELAAWIGLVPRQNSTGGKQKLGGISKQGDRYLRRLLVVGATAVIRHARTHPDKHPCIRRLGHPTRSFHQVWPGSGRAVSLPAAVRQG